MHFTNGLASLQTDKNSQADYDRYINGNFGSQILSIVFEGFLKYFDNLYFTQWMFLENFVRKVFDTNISFGYQRVRNLKKKWHF